MRYVLSTPFIDLPFPDHTVTAAEDRHSESPVLDTVEIEINALPAATALAGLWRSLEGRSDASFFLSWSWIGTWLDTLPSLDGLQLLVAKKNGRIVGLAVLRSEHRAWRKPFTTHAIHLNATGDPALDKITIEYNDVMCERGLEGEVRQAVASALFGAGLRWDELHLAGVVESFEGFSEPGSRLDVDIRREACYSVDLLELDAPSGDLTMSSMAPLASMDNDVESRIGQNYMSRLSSGTRARIRRSMRGYSAIGPLQLFKAGTAEEALDYLDGLRVLHQSRWAAKGEPGAFSDPYFGKFHRALIERCFDRGEIQLLKLCAGSEVVGYLYSFMWRGEVLYYQSGFDYSVAADSAQPGLVINTLAIILNAASGASRFDFMAGTNATKRSLATQEGELLWMVLRRPGARLWIDRTLRHFKRGS